MSWPARTPALPGLSPALATMPEAGCGLILADDLPHKPVSALGRSGILHQGARGRLSINPKLERQKVTALA